MPPVDGLHVSRGKRLVVAYVTKVGWKFNAIEYYSYEDFKADVDKFLAAKPRFKTVWDEFEEVQPCVCQQGPL